MTEVQQYQSAEPFPHICLDKFLDDPIAIRASNEFPSTDFPNWQWFGSQYEKKMAYNVLEGMPYHCKKAIQFLNSPSMVKQLEELTGIDGLIADPFLIGGGLHQIRRGGFLEIHADFDRHPYHPWERRINLLLYLNSTWEEQWGGHLELWDREMTRPVQRYLPTFNRCVIFNTTATSFHGHPEPLDCPEDRMRKSIAIYYYTKLEKDITGRNTLFQRRP